MQSSTYKFVFEGNNIVAVTIENEPFEYSVYSPNSTTNLFLSTEWVENMDYDAMELLAPETTGTINVIFIEVQPDKKKTYALARWFQQNINDVKIFSVDLNSVNNINMSYITKNTNELSNDTICEKTKEMKILTTFEKSMSATLNHFLKSKFKHYTEVNLTVDTIAAFSTAWKCHETTEMNKEEKYRIKGIFN